MPSALLGNADGAGDLIAAHAVLAVRQHPHGYHPFVESKGAISEDRSDLDAELFLAPTALPTLLICKPDGVADLAATHADDLTIGPAHCRDFINANLLIAKVLNRVYECLGVCHKERIATLVRLVKYIITNRVTIIYLTEDELRLIKIGRGRNVMADPIQEHADKVALQMIIDSLIWGLERSAARNKAYSEVIQTLPNQPELMGLVRQRETTLARSEPEKYSDLRNQAIQALEDHSPDALVQLARTVQERVRTWGLA